MARYCSCQGSRSGDQPTTRAVPVQRRAAFSFLRCGRDRLRWNRPETPRVPTILAQHGQKARDRPWRIGILLLIAEFTPELEGIPAAFIPALDQVGFPRRQDMPIPHLDASDGRWCIHGQIAVRRPPTDLEFPRNRGDLQPFGPQGLDFGIACPILADSPVCRWRARPVTLAPSSVGMACPVPPGRGA